MKGLDAHFDRQLDEYQRRIDADDAYDAELEKRTDEQIEIIEDSQIIDLLCDDHCGLAEAARSALYEMVYADKGPSVYEFNEAAKGFADAVTMMIRGVAKKRAEESIAADLSDEY
jgi:hypothetical protein